MIVKISKEIFDIYPILEYLYDSNGALYEESKLINATTKYLNNNKVNEDEKEFLNLLMKVFEDNKVKKNK